MSAAAFFGTIASIGNGAGAATTFSTPMTVTAVYAGATSITVSPLNFGNVGYFGQANYDAVATIVYRGPQGEVTLGGGLNSSASNPIGTNLREMSDNANPNNAATPSPGNTAGATPTQYLPYALFQDPSRTVAWGDDNLTATGAGLQLNPHSASPITLYVYGRVYGVPENPAAIGNTFTDTVLVTVTE